MNMTENFYFNFAYSMNGITTDNSISTNNYHF